MEITSPPEGLAKHRLKASQSLLSLCRQSEEAERVAREHLQADVAAVTASKRLRVADEVREGFPLVGWLAPSGIWENSLEPPMLTVSALVESAEDISL